MVFDNKNGFFVTLIVSVIVLSSCSGQNHLYFSEEVDLSAAEPSFALLVVEADVLKPVFPDHQFGSLRPAERRLLHENLPQLINRTARVDVNGFVKEQVLRENEFDLRAFQVRNNTIEMISPVSGSVLTDGTSNARFVLILDQFFFTPYDIEVGGGTYAGHENRTELRMRLEMNYLIWDNVSKEAAGWGQLNISRRFDAFNQNSSYVTILQEALDLIMMSTPFS